MLCIKVIALILYMIQLCITTTHCIFDNKFTGDVSPFSSPVVKLRIPTTGETDNRSKSDLEFKLYALIRRERSVLKGFQKIASVLDSQVTDLTRRVEDIEHKKHNELIH